MAIRRQKLPILTGFAPAALAIQKFHSSMQTLVTDNPPLSLLKEPRAPMPFEFADEGGKQVTLANFRGQNILLNVWATWCPPCRDELPSLDRLKAMLDRDR